MRPRHWFLAVPLVLAAGLSDSREADEWKGSLNFTLGQTTLDDDVKPAEDHTHFGARWTFGKSSWPIMLAVDVSASTGDGSETYYYDPAVYYHSDLNADVDTTTLSFGVRKEWAKDKTHPFLGGGVEWTRVDMKADVEAFGAPPVSSFSFVDDSDSDLGLWIDAGIYWRLGKQFNLGFNARYSKAEVSLQEKVLGTSFEMDVSGIGYGVLLGWGW